MLRRLHSLRHARMPFLLFLLLLGGLVLLGPPRSGVRSAAAQGVGPCAPPTVNLSVSPTTPTAGEPVTIRFTATAPPAMLLGGCATPPLPFMLINFGDGQAPLPLAGPAGSITHSYAVPGSYAVLVTASTAGRVGQARAIITVAAAAQQRAITLQATPRMVRAGDLVDFLGQVVTDSDDPNVVTTSAVIFFGDNQADTPLTTGAGFIAQHAYRSVGTYAATLSVTDSSGRIAQASVTITVIARTVVWP